MRRVGVVFIGIGLAFLVLGGSLRFAAWRGQVLARQEWENGKQESESEAGEEAAVAGVEPRQSPVHPPDAARSASLARSTRSVARTRLSFPALGEEFFVGDEATTAALLRGPAHIAGSGDPGDGGNCIIAGHRDTHFRILRSVTRGQEIDVDRSGQTFRYRIVDLAVVEAKDDRFYRPTREPVLTLVTCFPFSYFGRAPQRFIVRAELLASGSSL